MALSQTSFLTIIPELWNLDLVRLERTRALIFPVSPVEVWRAGCELLLDIIPKKPVCLWNGSQCVGAVSHVWTVVDALAAKVGGAACRNQREED